MSCSGGLPRFANATQRTSETQARRHAVTSPVASLRHLSQQRQAEARTPSSTGRHVAARSAAAATPASPSSSNSSGHSNPWRPQHQPPSPRQRSSQADVRTAAAYTAAYPLPQRQSSSNGDGDEVAPTPTTQTSSSSSRAATYQRSLQQQQQSLGFTLEDLVSHGAALSLVPEPAALLRGAGAWNLSSSIRQAIETAVQSGLHIALVQIPQLHPSEQASSSSRGWDHLHNHQEQQQQQQQGLGLDIDAAAAVARAIPYEVAPGDQRYLLLLEPSAAAVVAEQQQLLQERRSSHHQAGTSTPAAGERLSRTASTLQRIQSAAMHQVQPPPQAAAAAAAGSAALQHMLHPQHVSSWGGSTHRPAAAAAAAAVAAPSAAEVLTVPFYSRARARPLQEASLEATAAVTVSPPMVKAPVAAPREQSLEPDALTARLRGCRSAIAVQQLVEQHWERLDYIQVTAAVVALAKIHQASVKGAANASSSSSNAYSTSSSSVSVTLAPQAGHAQAATGAANSSSSVSRVFAHSLMLLAEQHLGNMQSRQISTTLWGVAALGWRPSGEWIARFAEAAEGFLMRGTIPQGYANLVWALATLGWTPPPGWMHTFYTASAAQLSRGGFKPQEVSSMLWALGTLRQKPPPAWCSTVMQAGAAVCSAANPQALSNMVWGLAVMGVTPDPQWVAAVQYACRRQAAGFTPKGMANLLWGMGMMTGCRSAYATRVVTASDAWDHHSTQQQQGGGQAQQASRQQQQQQQQRGAVAFSTKGQHWMLPEVTSRLQPSTTSSSSSEAPSPAAALAVNGARTAWLTDMVGAVQKQLHRYPGQALANVLWALAALQYPVPEQLLLKSSQAALLQMPYVTGGAAASLLWAYGKSGARLTEAWVVKAVARVVADAASCNPRHLANAVEAVALWTRQQQQQQQQQQEAGQGVPAPVSDAAAGAGVSAGNQQVSSSVQQQLEALLDVSHQQLLRFGVVELCEVGRALASLRVTPSAAWQELYLGAIAQQLPRLMPGHYTLLLRVLGAWGTTPDGGWTAAFFAAAGQALTRFDSGDVSNLLASLAAGKVTPTAEQLQPVLDRLLQVALHPAPLVQAVQSLAALGYRPPAQWLQQLWVVSEPVLGSCNGQQLSQLLSCCAALRITPPMSWAGACHAACSQLLTVPGLTGQRVGFDPEAAVAVLWSTAIMHRGAPPHVVAQLVAVAAEQLQQLPLEASAKGFWAAVELGAFSIAVDHQVLEPLTSVAQSPAADGSNRWAQESEAAVAAAAAGLVAGTAAAAAGAGEGDGSSLRRLQASWLQQQLLSHEQLQSQQEGASQLSVQLYLAQALVKLQQQVPVDWAGPFAASLEQQLPEANPLQLLVLLRVLPLLGSGAAQQQLGRALLEAVQPVLHQYSPGQLTELVTALEGSGCCPDPDWMQHMCQQVLAPQLPNLRGWQAVTVLLSLARLRYAPDPSFLQTAAQVAVVKLQYIEEPVVLVDLVWALTSLGWRPGKRWVLRVAARCSQLGLETMEPVQLVRLLWCFASLRRHPGAAWCDDALAVLGRQLRLLEPQSLADLLWAVAAFEEQPPKPWLAALLSEARQLLPSFTPASLVRLTWALALLQQRPPSSWVDALLLEVGHRVPDLNGPQLSLLLWSLATLDVDLPGPLLAQAAAAAESALGQLSVDQLSQLLWAVDRLDDSPHRVWFKRLAAAARQQRLLLVGAAGSSEEQVAAGSSSMLKLQQRPLVALRPQRVVAASRAVAGGRE